MPKLKPSSMPKHCIAAAVKQSYVRIGGQKIYTGKLDPTGKITPEADKEYRRILSEYLAGQYRLPKQGGITVEELALRFMKEHIPTIHPAHKQHFQVAFKTLLSIYGGTLAADFDVPQLEAIRTEFMKNDWTRG
jgi:hypothetical protein